MSGNFLCARCRLDPQPQNFLSPRRCAFNAGGEFTSDNWNCATLAALDKYEDTTEHYGEDETMQAVLVILALPDGDCCTDGFIVFNRYKHDGRCTSAMRVGNFWPAKPLTLDVAEALIGQYESREVAP